MPPVPGQAPGMTRLTGGASARRNKVTVTRQPYGDMYVKNGTVVANEDWRPDPGTDDITRIASKYDAAPATESSIAEKLLARLAARDKRK